MRVVPSLVYVVNITTLPKHSLEKGNEIAKFRKECFHYYRKLPNTNPEDLFSLVSDAVMTMYPNS